MPQSTLKESASIINPYHFAHTNPYHFQDIHQVWRGGEVMVSKPPSPWTKTGAAAIMDLCLYDPESVQPKSGFRSIQFPPEGHRETFSGGFTIHSLTTLSGLRRHAHEFQGKTVADLGSGTGIQALGMLALGARHVVLYEINKVALETARCMIDMNGFGSRATYIHDDLANIRQHHRAFRDVTFVVANIGDWEDYDGPHEKAHQQALQTTKLTQVKTYIAGGYRYELSPNLWNYHATKQAVGQDSVETHMHYQGFTLTNQIDAHSPIWANCSRTFIYHR